MIKTGGDSWSINYSQVAYGTIYTAKMANRAKFTNFAVLINRPFRSAEVRSKCFSLRRLLSLYHVGKGAEKNHS